MLNSQQETCQMACCGSFLRQTNPRWQGMITCNLEETWMSFKNSLKHLMLCRSVVSTWDNLLLTYWWGSFAIFKTRKRWVEWYGTVATRLQFWLLGVAFLAWTFSETDLLTEHFFLENFVRGWRLIRWYGSCQPILYINCFWSSELLHFMSVENLSGNYWCSLDLYL